MKEGSPASAGCSPGRELSSIGRATRFESTDGRELWRLPATDETIAERLLALGRDGVGGFGDGGRDADGIWLVRSPIDPTLSRHIKQHPGLAWREAVLLATEIARALEACERLALFPGPLTPGQISVREPGPRVELRAEPLVRTLVGAAQGESKTGRGSPGDSASPRWIAPEQAGGAPWDNAANRYVLGLIFYRLLSGEHAFGGKGLRLGLEEAAHRAPPPLPEAVASELPPGLQALCLRLLDPDPKQRPKKAAEIVARLQELGGGARASVSKRARAAEPPEERERERAPAVASVPTRVRSKQATHGLAWARSIAPFVIGGGLAAALLSAFDRKPDAPARALERPPVGAGQTLAKDCASCHPRQAGEWHRSVMAHSLESPLFQALEIVIQEQVGRDIDCPNGAGILREADPATACRDRVSGLPVTGSGGELWCVNCHAPGENLAPSLPAWDGRGLDGSSRKPLRDLLGAQAQEGISCGFCHQVHGPVRPGDLARGGYEGNPFWTSTQTGRRFSARPEDASGRVGIANSGYSLDPAVLLAIGDGELVAGGAHKKLDAQTRDYLRSSEFCGSCHDVRLFGTDVIGVRRGEHFKRLRNAYSEWVSYAELERRAGTTPPSCQDCHMSTYPGVCVPGKPAASAKSSGWVPTAFERACPDGFVFEPRAPGSRPEGLVATSSGKPTQISPHYFSGVDLPLASEFSRALIDELTLDAAGTPLGARQRRDLLLAASVRMQITDARLGAGLLEIPIEVENVGAGHRLPAGFSQERELWVHLRVTDATGRVVYEVGRVERHDEDLRDKLFLRVNTEDRFRDGQGRPLGVFGADVADGPDVPRWNPNPARGGTLFRGQGLINFQNGFMRCVTCIGVVDSLGRCQPLPGQERSRADRYADGSYDIDTGECRSNLSGDEALFEIFFPVGSLDATRGVFKGPDAIIDTRSLSPKVPVTYVYELPSRGLARPITAEARLLFRAFPPYLVRAFADYERRQAEAGKRPSGPLITDSALERIEVIELGRARAVIP